MLFVLYELGHQADRGEVIRFFRVLESAGCGEYVEGRHGHPSRFEWSDFRLRAETIVRFRLPGDLTEREANRLAECGGTVKAPATSASYRVEKGFVVSHPRPRVSIFSDQIPISAADTQESVKGTDESVSRTQFQPERLKNQSNAYASQQVLRRFLSISQKGQ
jgi:hypothetical protein